MAKYRTHIETYYYRLSGFFSVLLGLSFAGLGYYLGWLAIDWDNEMLPFGFFVGATIIIYFIFRGLGVTERFGPSVNLVLSSLCSTVLVLWVRPTFFKEGQAVSLETLAIFSVGILLCWNAGGRLFESPFPAITDPKPTFFGKLLILAQFPMVTAAITASYLSFTLTSARDIALLTVVAFFLTYYIACNVLFPERVSLTNWIDDLLDKGAGLYDPNAIVERVYSFCKRCRSSISHGSCHKCHERRFIIRDNCLLCAVCGYGVPGLTCHCTMTTQIDEMWSSIYQKRTRQRKRLHGRIVKSVECFCPRCLQAVVHNRCSRCGNQAFRVISDQSFPEIECTSCKFRAQRLICTNRLYDRICDCDILLDFAAFRFHDGSHRWFAPWLRDAFDDLTTVPHKQFLPADMTPVVSVEGTGRAKEKASSEFRVSDD